jgi:hypothetical protein
VNGTFVFPVNPNITVDNVFTSDEGADDHQHTGQQQRAGQKEHSVAAIDSRGEFLRVPLAGPLPAEVTVTYVMPLASADKFRIWLPYGIPSRPVKMVLTMNIPVPFCANIQGSIVVGNTTTQVLTNFSNLALNVHTDGQQPRKPSHLARSTHPNRFKRQHGNNGRVDFLSLEGVSVRLTSAPTLSGFGRFINLVPGGTRGNADWTIHARPHKLHVNITFTQKALFSEADFRDSLVLRSYAAYVLTRNREMMLTGQRLCSAFCSMCLFAPKVKSPVHSRQGSDEYLCLARDYPDHGDVDPENQELVLSCLRIILDSDEEPIDLLDPPACLLFPPASCDDRGSSPKVGTYCVGPTLRWCN